jgi:hypothetical protein
MAAITLPASSGDRAFFCANGTLIQIKSGPKRARNIGLLQ